MSKKEIEQLDGEINLFELVEYLWKEKVLIVAITAVITLIGLGYALSTPLTYEARVEISSPSISDISEFQKFVVIQPSQTQTQTQKQTFLDFLSVLSSIQLRKNFLREEGVMELLFDKETSQQEAVAKLDKMIELEVSKEDPNYKASFKFQSGDAVLAAKFANRLVELAFEQYRMNISHAFDSIKDQKIKKLKDKKNILIGIYDVSWNQEINKLKEAYLIAKELDITEPQVSNDRLAKSYLGSSSITKDIRYLYSQGSRALNAEIAAITKLKNNHSMVQGLKDIQQQLLLLNISSFDASKVTPVTIDLTAETLDGHIKPNRTKIVIISSVIGGFLAIIFVLIRKAVRNRKSHS